MDTVIVSLFELVEASRRVHRFTAMSFSMRRQKLGKLCREYKISLIHDLLFLPISTIESGVS